MSLFSSIGGFLADTGAGKFITGVAQNVISSKITGGSGVTALQQPAINNLVQKALPQSLPTTQRFIPTAVSGGTLQPNLTFEGGGVSVKSGSSKKSDNMPLFIIAGIGVLLAVLKSLKVF